MNSSLNDIVLNGTMLESLYARSLVEIAPSAPPVSYLGSNAKRVTVLIRQPEFAFLPEDQLAFLARLLNACKLNTSDIAIVNMASQATMEQVSTQLSPEKIISFGFAPPGAATPLLTTGTLSGVPYLSAPALAEMLQDTEESRMLKGRLWLCLKHLFDIE